jgi:metal-sulfur cluster biosynthetic enzyme
MTIEERIYDQLQLVIDPELNINVVDLGLIYEVEVTENNYVMITMTLTTPGCPLHDSITSGVKYAVSNLEGVTDVDVILVWEPAWSPDKMTPEGMKLLGR